LFSGTAAAEALDHSALAAIRAMGLDAERSRVMETASYMMDVLGPRLSGSPNIKRSAEWVVETLKGWGLTGAAMEPWPEDPTGTNYGFPRGWSNEKFYLHATSPNAFPISGMSIAWTPGTKGLVSGECIVVTERSESELRQYRGKLRGKWILGQAPVEMRAQWDPVARRLSQSDLDALEAPPPETGARPDVRVTPPSGGPMAYDRNAFFFKEGALGVLSTNKGHGAVNVMGASRYEDPDMQLPRIAIEAEHYGRMARSVMLGMPVVIEADIRNAWYDNPPMFNVVGEIRGTTQPNEVVIIGGHFDSWHASTGATDNGGACAALMEAMRLLKAVNAPLKRTVRLCLWNGEEQGLIGSRLYVARHFGGTRGVPSTEPGVGYVMEPVKRDHGRVQVYLNVDNGAGAIRGVHCQGNAAVAPLFKQWMAPLRDLGMTHTSQRISRSTDHVSFDDAGLPGFQFIQDPMEYEPKTHHTNRDYFEALQPEDMRKNAVILAIFAMAAANHPGFLPRKLR
jgi:hypothetical protein